MEEIPTCACAGLGHLAVIGMGDPDGLDDRVFETIDRIKGHGGERWWLYASTCKACRQHWMIAQDERIHDNFVLKRITAAEMRKIAEHSDWPRDFLRYEHVLRLERESGKIARFPDSRSPALEATVIDLRRERPEISAEEIAFALAIPTTWAERLMRQ